MFSTTHFTKITAHGLAILLALALTASLASCGPSGYQFKEGDSLEIDLGGKAVQTVAETEFAKIEGLDGYLVFPGDLKDQGQAGYYLKGQTAPIFLKDEGLSMVTAFLSIKYLADTKVIWAEGHINPSLYAFLRTDVATGKTDVTYASVAVIGAGGHICSLLVPAGALDANPPVNSDIQVDGVPIGSVPSDIYDLTGDAKAFTLRSATHSYTIAKSDKGWEIK